MKTIALIILNVCLLVSSASYGQNIKLDEVSFLPVQVFTSVQKLDGKRVLKVCKDTALKAVDQPTYARVNNVVFKNGTIEVKVLSKLLSTANKDDRGFIGIAFHINNDNTEFEGLYIRPTNGRADNQVRRNHTVQYFSFPDYPYNRLRKENPEVYETYADMGLNEWIKLRVEVKGIQAKLFINDSKFPSFVVNDLKHGADAAGGIGLWVDVGTEGFFRDLKIVPASE